MRKAGLGPMHCKQARHKLIYKKYQNSNTKSSLSAASKHHKDTINHYLSDFTHKNAQKT